MENIVAEGRVKITYGFKEFDNCGNAGGGCKKDAYFGNIQTSIPVVSGQLRCSRYMNHCSGASEYAADAYESK